jgi:hypothetical protein
MIKNRVVDGRWNFLLATFSFGHHRREAQLFRAVWCASFQRRYASGMQTAHGL